MAYTTPATFVAGNILTAAQLNTYVRDNVAWIATDSPSCRVFKSAAFAHNSSGNFLAVTFDSERFDNASVHSTSSNTERLTIPTGGGGKYVVGGAAAWVASASGTTRILGVGVNGIVTFAAATENRSSGTVVPYQSILTIYSMAAADYFTMPTFQDTGGTLNISTAANYTPEFYCFWFRT